MRLVIGAITLLLTGPALAQPPPPAPTRETSRDDVLRALRSEAIERCLPLTVSTTRPEAVIRRVGGEWRLERLVVDEAAAERERRRRVAAGRAWMPEHLWRFMRPGPVLARGASARALADAIERLDWERLHIGPSRSETPRVLCRSNAPPTPPG